MLGCKSGEKCSASSMHPLFMLHRVNFYLSTREKMWVVQTFPSQRLIPDGENSDTLTGCVGFFSGVTGMVMVIYPEEFTDLSICIRTAARIIADDIGEWKGEIFSDIDVSPFRRNGGKNLGLVMFTAHEYAHLEPIGKMKIACEAIEAAMVRAVELNQIKPLQLSRHLSGEIKPEQTFLGLTDIFKWCEVVDLQVGETLFEYLETEQNLRTNMIRSTNKERFKLENRAALDQSRESTDKLWTG